MNILLTSAGRRAYIVEYFKQCEGINRVFTCNSEYSIALQKSDGYFISPLIYSDEYIKSIVSFCINNDIKAIISLFDIDLPILAKHENVFSEHNIKLILGPENFVKICNDKFLTFEFLNKIGIKTPNTYKTISSIKKALENGIITFPIILKPRWGMASMGIYKAYNLQELEVLSNICNRDIFSSYLKYESKADQNEAIIFQQIVKGQEYGIDILNDLNGNFINAFVKKKIKLRSGETDLGETVNNKPFINVAKKISMHSHHKGLLSVDCFMNNENIIILEMNCRISGHYPLSYLAGFNYPQIIIDWLNDKKINTENLTFKENLLITKDLVPTVLNRQEY